jgi:hypothetical protein
VIYFAAGYSVIHAVDAVSGRLLWKYDPKVTGYKMRLAWGSRGMAFWKGEIYAGTQDGFVRGRCRERQARLGDSKRQAARHSGTTTWVLVRKPLQSLFSQVADSTSRFWPGGRAAVSGGFAPDLRASVIPLSESAFDAVVRGGSLESRGMPRFADLSEADLEDLRHYLRSRARESLSTSTEEIK